MSRVDVEKGSDQVIVAGAGIGGISAAVAAARRGARTLLVEQLPQVGGTGVHSPVGLVCTYFDRSGRYINTGLHREFFPHLYEESPWLCQVYDERELLDAYQRVVAATPGLTVRTSTAISRCLVDGGRIMGVELGDGEIVHAAVMIDATAEGNLAALAGAQFQLGRALDGRLQPATLTFRAGPVDLAKFGLSQWRSWESVQQIWKQLGPYYAELKQRGGTINPKAANEVLALPDRAGKTLLFNHTRIQDVDPTDPQSLERGMRQGRQQVEELWGAVRQHPALQSASILSISTKLGVREGRRIVGDYMLTEHDCLSEARFDDMVAACGYALDIHDPIHGGARLERIPGSGYYHIPYRCLVAKGMPNLLLGSRCISGTHEAHSSYRVMAPISAIGQAAGVAAALAVKLNLDDVRQVRAEWIRHELARQGQFVEGAVNDEG